ncbi:MAG: sorbosone dehydrogenase family protein [Candidatus Eisenbacteria bacterium]|uniref:Sorbosone dehydrogenase family protein n=1 Tax=Eiseniibacteriota bacterium TaxID=2212470 RepID=A0A7Y2E8V0_UNCEI|nr:sorbosone dehydrogenase family protein [Candidatus Eisenbacteria bacterium]
MVGLLLLAPMACSNGSSRATGSLDEISLPDGFRIEVYAEGIPGARSMAIGPGGTLFVGTRGQGKVYALLDTDQDLRIDEVREFASDLFVPNGVAFRGADLYVAEINRVLKYANAESHLEKAPTPEVINDTFPRDKHHGWKFIRFGPDDKLYVPVGAPCNVCVKKDERFSSILRMNPDGTNLEVFAHGVRNTVGFDWHPETQELWFTDNGRDWLGDDAPPDELNHAPVMGLHFGFPYCHGDGIQDPDVGQGKNCADYRKPAKSLQAHAAALGMRFYTGDQFPSDYRNQIFIPEHGSWNRSSKVGYRVALVRKHADGSLSYEPFATGWLRDEEVWGRPVDIEFLRDGSMLVSDDFGGKIYRIWYES